MTTTTMRRIGPPLALDRSGKTRLELTTAGGLGDVRVLLDGALVHAFSSLDDLRRGASVRLEDGSVLSVRFHRRYGSLVPGLDVRRDDRALPGSVFDPVRRVRLGTWTLVGAGLAGLLFLRANPIVNAIVFVQLGMFALLGALARLGKRWAAVVGFSLGAILFALMVVVNAVQHDWPYVAVAAFCAWSLVGDVRAALDLDRAVRP